MPYEDPPQDSLALCGTCWMFTGVFVLVLGLVLTALGYVENYVIAFRIAGPCFIGGSCLMLTAATACCVSAHIKDKSRLRRNARPSRPIRQHATNSRHRSRNHSRSRPSSHSRTTSFQNRQVRINSIPQVEVVPPTPQLHPNLNALVGLTFLPPMQSGRLGTPISDEEMLSDYDNVPKKRRGNRRQAMEMLTRSLETVTETSPLVNEQAVPTESQSSTSITMLLSPGTEEIGDTNAEPPPSYEDVMAHLP